MGHHLVICTKVRVKQCHKPSTSHHLIFVGGINLPWTQENGWFIYGIVYSPHKKHIWIPGWMNGNHQLDNGFQTSETLLACTSKYRSAVCTPDIGLLNDDSMIHISCSKGIKCSPISMEQRTVKVETKQWTTGTSMAMAMWWFPRWPSHFIPMLPPARSRGSPFFMRMKKSNSKFSWGKKEWTFMKTILIYNNI